VRGSDVRPATASCHGCATSDAAMDRIWQFRLFHASHLRGVGTSSRVLNHADWSDAMSRCGGSAQSSSVSRGMLQRGIVGGQQTPSGTRPSQQPGRSGPRTSHWTSQGRTRTGSKFCTFSTLGICWTGALYSSLQMPHWTPCLCVDELPERGRRRLHPRTLGKGCCICRARCIAGFLQAVHGHKLTCPILSLQFPYQNDASA
jgi:hypothetical protein